MKVSLLFPSPKSIFNVTSFPPLKLTLYWSRSLLDTTSGADDNVKTKIFAMTLTSISTIGELNVFNAVNRILCRPKCIQRQAIDVKIRLEKPHESYYHYHFIRVTTINLTL